MSTETATPTKATSKSSTKPPVVVEDVKTDDVQEQAAAKAQAEQDEALDILEPKVDPKIWVIGKPPEKGGTDEEFSVYTQKPLGYMARMRFFSLVSKTIGTAIRSGGSIDMGGDFLNTVDDIRKKGRNLDESDFADAGAFLGLAMQLISYSPDFLLECYCLWLDVPMTEKIWAKMVMEQPSDPDRNKWGLTDEMGLEMVEIFIDQNYEDIRRFFVEKLPALARRVKQLEAQHKDPESTLALSKQ